MSLHRRNARRDVNEPAIVQAIEACGWSVDRISAPGVPDLLCAHRRFGIVLVECKSVSGRLTAVQRAWRERWRGPDPLTVRSLDDVIALMNS